MNNTQLLKIILAITATIVCWSSAYVGIRIGLNSFSPGSLALLRYLTASVVMILIYLRIPNRHGLKWRDAPAIFCLGTAGFAVYNIMLNYGEKTVEAAITGFLIALIPVIMVLLARIFFKEKLSKQAIVGITVSIIGVILISYTQSHNLTINIGVLYIFVAVLAGATYAIFQKPLLKKYHPIEFAAYAIWGGTLMLVLFTPQLWHQLPYASTRSILWVIYLGVFPAAVGFMSWSYVLSQLPTAKASSLLYSVPVLSLFLGWIFIHEIPSMLAISGGLIAILGAMIVNYRRNKVTTTKKISA